MNTKKFLKSKRLKHGSLSIILSVSFIGIILALNLILSSVSSKVNLAIDVTPEELYSISEETKAVLKTLGDDFDITFYFLQDRDLYEEDQYTLMIRQLGEEYARLYPDNINVVYKDINKDPSFVTKYLDETQTKITPNHIIVEGSHHHRVLSLNSFFQISQETGKFYSFQGELRFTAAILQSCIKEPQVVTFTIGHDETTSIQMLDILTSAGFEIQQKDLSKEDIDERTEILIISNPQADLIGFEGSESNADVKNEIDKISEYMKGFKDIIVFVNASTPSLPNLQEYLELSWGISYKPNYKISDVTHSIVAGENTGYSVVGQYVGTKETQPASYNMTKVAAGAGSGIKTVFNNAVELEIMEDTTDKFTVETVMQTFDTAKSTYISGEDGTETETTGQFPLMLLSVDHDYGENNALKYKYVLLVSSTDFASDEILKTNSFGNRKVILGAARIMSTEWVTPDIDVKPFIDEAMELEAGKASSLAWFICLVFPLIVILAGLIVFIKRRHL